MEKNKILAILQENYYNKITDIDFLRDSGGTTYVANSNEGKFLLKIAGKSFLDTLRQSVDVMCYLAKNHFPVPTIIKTKLGTPMLEITEDSQTYLFILFEYIEGQEPNLNVCGEQVGDLIGWLHKLLSSYKGELIKRDFPFFIQRYVDILHRKNYPQADKYASMGKMLWEHVKDCPVGICHGDLHRGNLLESTEGKIYLLDFDTICIAPRMFDLATMCDMTDYFHLQSKDLKTTAAVYQSFLKGYSNYAKLTEYEQGSFKNWMAIRHFQLQATIVEVFGLDCIDHHFIDQQLQWLENFLNNQKEV